VTWLAITTLCILITTGGLIVYDFVAGHYGGYEATLSAHVLEWSLAYPVITLAAGILFAHLFLPSDIKLGWNHPVLPLALGVALGYVFWNQR